MKALIYVFLGGGTGSMLRYYAQTLINKGVVCNFPLGTFTVNVVGSFLIGIFYVLSERLNLSPETRLMLTVGFCGGFTTFSTFSTESLNLFKEQLYGVFALYISASILIGIASTFAGAWLARSL